MDSSVAVVGCTRELATVTAAAQELDPDTYQEQLDVLEAADALASFPAFVRLAWPHADARHTTITGMRLRDPSQPESDWNPRDRLPRQMHAIAIHLQAWVEGTIDLLSLEVCPGSGKSVVASVLLPAWIWLRHPGDSLMFGSYSESPSERDSSRNRRLVGSEWYQKLLARTDHPWSVTKDTTGNWQNDAGGSRLIVTRTGRGTGFRGRRIVVDDGIKAIEATSDAALSSTVEWISQTLWTRNYPGEPVRMLIIGQRVCDRDPGGWARSTGAFTVVCLPAEYEPGRHCTTHVVDPETGEPWQDWRTEPGELLCPELHSPAYISGQKKILGSSFSAQYQQMPVDPATAMFPRSAWRFWRRRDQVGDWSHTRPKGCWQGPAVELDPDDCDRQAISLDATFKASARSDFVALQVWGSRRADRYLLDQQTERLGFVDTVKALLAMVTKWPDARYRLVEVAANGQAILAALERDVSGMVPIIPKESKESRAHSCTAEMQSSNLFLPEGAEWLEPFVAEFERFPRGSNDDRIDAATQYLNWMHGAMTAEERFLALSTW